MTSADTLFFSNSLFQEVNLSHNRMTKMKDLSAYLYLSKLDLGCILTGNCCMQSAEVFKKKKHTDLWHAMLCSLLPSAARQQSH